MTLFLYHKTYIEFYTVIINGYSLFWKSISNQDLPSGTYIYEASVRILEQWLVTFIYLYSLYLQETNQINNVVLVTEFKSIYGTCAIKPIPLQLTSRCRTLQNFRYLKPISMIHWSALRYSRVPTVQTVTDRRALCILLVRRNLHSDSFLPGIVTSCNKLPPWYVPEKYNIKLFNLRINRYFLSTTQFTNPLHEWFLHFVSDEQM